MDNPSTSTTPTTATNFLAVLAEMNQSHSPQSSLSDLIDEQNGGTGGADCPFVEKNATTGRCRQYRIVIYEGNWTLQLILNILN